MHFEKMCRIIIPSLIFLILGTIYEVFSLDFYTQGCEKNIQETGITLGIMLIILSLLLLLANCYQDIGTCRAVFICLSILDITIIIICLVWSFVDIGLSSCTYTNLWKGILVLNIVTVCILILLFTCVLICWCILGDESSYVFKKLILNDDHDSIEYE